MSTEHEQAREGAASPTVGPSREWTKLTAPFLGPDTRRSVLQLTGTALAFVGLWVAMYWSLGVSYWLTLALALPTAGFVVRLFMIQHDCGHGSYFRSRKARDRVGFVIGVLTLVPYQCWRRIHAHHHAHSGNLDFRGFGDVETWTVREYLDRGFMQRLGYRLYRNPLILLGIGPFWLFVVKHRYPWGMPRDWKDAWASVWWTNLCLAGVLGAAWLTIGLGPFLMIQVPVTAAAGVLGVWLFYVQHQFEDTYWHEHPEWDFFQASILGSSHLVLPRPLNWITANIGIHHVHHLSSRIPNYRLQECLDANPELQQATRITIRDSWRLLRLSLWDEEDRRLIRFRELRGRKMVAA